MTAFDAFIAARYETLWPELFDPAVLDPAVDRLAELAGGGPVLEFGIGTGRVALPLRRRGLDVHGIDASAAMIGVMRERPGGADVPATVGDFSRVPLGSGFALVYLVRNTITNLTTQDDQVAAFRNAAAHLAPGGRFVIENYVPELRRLPPGETTYLFTRTDDHIAYEEYDLGRQIAVSHHTWVVDGELHRFSSPHRYVWPAELDLMARLAGLRLEHRWADWHRTPFDGESRTHVSVWTKPGQSTDG